jgi:hypothetical protein
MECIYNADGTIRKVYDEKYHNHIGLLTAKLTEQEAMAVEAYRINPNTKEAYIVPVCDAKYIKNIDNVLVEMDEKEKAALDAKEADALVTATLVDAEMRAKIEEPTPLELLEKRVKELEDKLGGA